MNNLRLFLFTNRPVIQAVFSGLEQLSYQPLLINFAPVAIEALSTHEQEVAATMVAAVDVASDPVVAIQVCQELHRRHPGLSILGMICCKKQVSLLHLQALTAAGVTSMLGLFVTPQEILQALERVAHGHIVVQLESSGDHSPFLANIIDGCTREGSTSALRLFVSSDTRLLELVAHGLSDREIGQQLYISSPTVRHHIQRLCKTTGARNRTELAAWAGAWGFYRPLNSSYELISTSDGTQKTYVTAR